MKLSESGKRRPNPLRIVIALIFFTMVVAGICYHFFGVDALEHLPPFSLCVFRTIASIDCPGCGMTRAMLAIGQLNFAKALEFNPLSMPLVIAMMIFLCQSKSAFSGLFKNFSLKNSMC